MNFYLSFLQRAGARARRSVKRINEETRLTFRTNWMFRKNGNRAQARELKCAIANEITRLNGSSIAVVEDIRPIISARKSIQDTMDSGA